MIRNYIKIAFRNLKKHKAFSLINIIGLSIALSVTICMLLYVEDELSYDRAHPNASQLYRVSMHTQVAETDFHSAWTPPFVGARMHSDFPEVSNYATLYKHFKGFAIKKNNEEISINDVYYSSPNFFDVFGFKLKYGNPESALKDPENIVLHEKLIAKLFPGESIMGTQIETTDGTKIVTGIIENSSNNNHFTPMVLTSIIGQWNIKDLATTVNFDASFYNYIQLSKGSKLSQRKLNEIANDYFKEWVNSDENRKNDFGNQKFELKIQHVGDIHLGSNLEFEMEANGNRSTVIIFSFAAILILIVASINYTNLASAKYLERMKELGIRKMLGSRRVQLAVQYFTESLVITLFSTFVAFIIILLAIPFFNAIADKSVDLGQLIQFKPILGLTIIVLGCSFFSSIYPALFITNIKPTSIFLFNSSGVGKGSRFRKAMLVLQIAVSGILLIFTFVIFQQYKFMQKHELGFQKDQIIVVEVKSREARSKIPILKNELLKLAEIKSVALTGQIPGSKNLKTEPMGFESNEGEITEILTNYIFSGPDLINALELKIIKGTNFDVSKGGANRGQEVIVNQSMANAMNWDKPIGKKVKLPIGDAVVVGVVNDFHLKSLHYKIQPLTIIYLDNWAEALLVKVNSESIGETIKEIKANYKSVIGGGEFMYSFLDEGYAMQYKSDQQNAKLFMIFSLLAICIACLGLIGLIGFTLLRRSKEISIRRVFGAKQSEIIALFSKEYVYVILTGLLIAIPVANYLIKDWLMNFPYKMNLSVINYIIPVSGLLLLAIMVIVLRTYKASKENPANTLRNE